MRLQAPTTDSIALIDDVVAERTHEPNKSFFRGIRAEWRSRVSHYIAVQGSPEHVKPWPEIAAYRGSFHNLYKSAANGSAHGIVLSALREQHELNLCPACGEPGTPNTLDHYLPKGLYPHFSITPINLFPMCDACQGAKEEKTGDTHTPRYFIHPYFDTFSAPQIVHLSIDPPFDKPTFSLFPNPTLVPAEIALVTTHLRELEIERRYVIFFKGEHRRLIRLVARMRNSSQHVAETIETFRVGAADPSPNSWQHIFYRAVLSNAALIDYLTNGQLPAYP